jgi:Abortive infection alpha
MENKAIEEIAKELAKQLPIKDMYEDLLKPPAIQLGNLSSDVIKVILLALAPVQYLATIQDRFRSFLDRSVRRVPERQRISPPPQILGPVLEGIRYEPEETPIDELFSQLLSRSMDRDRAAEAHPSYPHIIRQLSADEAKILSDLCENMYDYVYVSTLDQETRRFFRGATEIDELPRGELIFPNNVGFYMEHLSSLCLAGIYEYTAVRSISE